MPISKHALVQSASWRFGMSYTRGANDAACWVWTGQKNATGYGQFFCMGKRWYAHRVSYEIHVGPIPEGLQLDHLCRNRACVNPAHLEPVTCKENINRGNSPTAIVHRTGICRRGHALVGENVRLYKGRKMCRTCQREVEARRRAAARAQTPT